MSDNSLEAEEIVPAGKSGKYFVGYGIWSRHCVGFKHSQMKKGLSGKREQHNHR